MKNAAVLDALRTIDDPEYPGVSIVDLGLVERVVVDEAGLVHVGLIPTFSGCPALAVIADDVRKTLMELPSIHIAEVEWLTNPAWSVDRVSGRAREILATEFTVAVENAEGRARCPRCGGPTTEQSMFGPSRCRAVHTCDSCAETVEVMRG